MNVKKYLIIFSLFLVLLCTAASVSAVSDDLDNVTSQTNTIDEISKDNTIPVKQESVSNSTSEVLSENIGPQGSEILNENSKTDLKVVNYINFVKNGGTYNLYLTDSDGNAVADKNLDVNFNGKTYSKTTDSKGLFGITVNSKDTRGLADGRDAGLLGIIPQHNDARAAGGELLPERHCIDDGKIDDLCSDHFYHPFTFL